MRTNNQRVRLGCYGANIAMSVVSNLSPLLFLTFRHLYGLSFSLLGLLVLVNFVTQLSIDLVFSFFSHKFNIPAAVRASDLLAVGGFVLYALSPFLFSGNVYVGLVLGTVVFSASSGLNEVLLSPIVAALPSDNPERDMSKLHAVYAWGSVAVILFSTLFLWVCGGERWFFLPLLFTLVPLFSAVMFFTSTLPPLSTPKQTSGVLPLLKNKQLWVCFIAIFLGGACELMMAQWSSSYLEQALGIEKIWGDVFGTAMFALTLGLGRTLYAKYGKNMEKVLFLSAIGAFACYAICIFSPLPIFGLIACALTGFCVSMMWPGTLVVAASRITTGGVFLYAMMAAGGDLGASIAPQLLGVITDVVSASAVAADWATRLGTSVESLSMKIGMGLGVLLSLCAVFVFLYIFKTKERSQTNQAEALPLEGENGNL